jgi:CRISPR/Cas system-associated exonuclease Cas4 (RecB family)
VRGAAVHTAIAKVNRITFDQGTSKTSKEILIQAFKSAWQQQACVIETLKLPSKIVDDFYRESETMLLSWLKRQAQRKIKDYKCEVRLYSKSFGVMGIIDAVGSMNQRIVLIDYKTCASDEISRDIKVQLAIYALLYRENYNALPDIVGIDFLKSKKLRLFSVNTKLIDYAKEMCRQIHHKTQSKNENDYPCLCGGRCEKDFGF